MSASREFSKYDEVLTSILVSEKSILGFLSAIFNFLARRTDFYHVPEGQYNNMGFPPGVAEELVMKVLRKCDPKNWKPPNGTNKVADLNNEIMCSTVAQEVEVVAEGYSIEETAIEIIDTNKASEANNYHQPNSDVETKNEQLTISKKESDGGQIASKEPEYCPPVIPVQKNSDTYNGAERENYLWSQTIMELDVIVKLPRNVKSSKALKVSLNSKDVCVICNNGDVIIQDSLPYKIKVMESFWSISEGRLLIHFEKAQERWWNKFLSSEDEIDLAKIDCSRPLDDLPEDHVDKVRELQWNQEQRIRGLPTSDEIRNIQILKKAWNAPGSPFQGQEFDPNVLSQSNVT